MQGFDYSSYEYDSALARERRTEEISMIPCHLTSWSQTRGPEGRYLVIMLEQAISYVSYERSEITSIRRLDIL